MRVIAGKFKGRRLQSPPGMTARPTADRVREALFGALQFRINGLRVLDAFAGSGALGIEALSRGAAHVDFAEQDEKCIVTIKKNLGALKTENYRIYRGDVIRLLSVLGSYDLLLADPPYDSDAYIPLLEAAHKHGSLNAGAIAVLETKRRFDFVPPMGYNLTKHANYGETSLWYLAYGE